MYEQTASDGSLGTPEDAGKGQAGEVSRWLMEIELSGKTEASWRKQANKAIDRYRDEKERQNWQFNIYWANVETLRPALYSTVPKLDIRRRFADADPIGKLAAEVMERALDYCMDSYDFDEEIDNILSDYQIPSRAVARVRFEPTIDETETEDGEIYENLTYAKTYIEHVAWDRFRRGPGITWKEVPWIAYEHQLVKNDVNDKFPDFKGTVDYDITMEGVSEERAAAEPSVFKRVRIWEIWDKSKRKIYWIAPSYKDGFLKVEDDKLSLEGFFDCERPLYAVKTATTLVPIVEYEMYRDQAKELDRVTARIGKIVNGLKLRGIYDATVTELKDVMKASDNEMIPIQNSNAAMAAGGLDKAVWTWPIQEAAGVLKELLSYRESVKQTIYEITGMSDILRGATDPDETLGAQQLKAQTGSKRIQRRQRDIQRFIRGLLRKKAEIIAENYTPELLAMMTGVQLPRDADKQAAQQQVQMMQQMQPQQPPPPEVQQLLASPTWEDVMKVLKDDLLRTFRIDIETDSTIAADQEADREQVTEMIKGIGDFLQNVGPAVEQGAMSQDTAKKILLACVRRFKFGREVEDAIDQDKGQPQQQKPDPEMAKVQAQMQLEDKKLENAKQLETFKAQNAAQLDHSRNQSDAQLAEAQQQSQARQDSEQQALEANRREQEMRLQHEADIKKMLLDHKLDVEQAQAQSETRIKEIIAKAHADLMVKNAETGMNVAADAIARHQDHTNNLEIAKNAPQKE